MKLSIQPTTTAQWLSLLHEAQSSCALTLGEELESYLVFLLMRFTNQPEIAHSVIALEFLNGLNSSGPTQHNSLRDVGDKCLLFAGLFPERAKRRRLRVSYFVDVGKGAYQSLAQANEHSLADLFANLNQSFVPLMDVLQATRDVAQTDKSIDLLQATELWQDTHSQQALETLIKAKKIIPPYDLDENKRH